MFSPGKICLGGYFPNAGREGYGFGLEIGVEYEINRWFSDEGASDEAGARVPIGVEGLSSMPLDFFFCEEAVMAELRVGSAKRNESCDKIKNFPIFF